MNVELHYTGTDGSAGMITIDIKSTQYAQRMPEIGEKITTDKGTFEVKEIRWRVDTLKGYQPISHTLVAEIHCK